MRREVGTLTGRATLPGACVGDLPWRGFCFQLSRETTPQSVFPKLNKMNNKQAKTEST